MVHRSFEWRTLRTPKRARRWPSVSTRLGRMYLFINPWVVHCLQTESLRARRGNCSVSCSMTSGIPLPPIPQGRLSTSFVLRNSDLLPILHVGKGQSREPFGRLLREQSQILPIDSGESPPFLIDESPQFHAISCPPDKVQSCFAVKETAFQFGCSNFPGGRTRSYTCMGWSVAISIALDHSKLLLEHGVCQKPATSLIFPLPSCGAESTICTSHPCRLQLSSFFLIDI